MANSVPLGVAVIGLGVGERHARRFHADRNCHVRLLCDLDFAKAEALAQELGAEVVPDFETIIKSLPLGGHGRS